MSRKNNHTFYNSKKNDPLSISVFFPCYNEQDNINKSVKQAIEMLKEMNADYEIIIVDDGSSDNTSEIADRLAGENKNVKVVHHTRNLGYGAALQSGFKNAKKELVFYTDGDAQFDIRELPPLMPLMNHYDIISCYRINRQDPFLRKINGLLWSKLVSLLFRMKIKDVDCAFKLYKTEIFQNIEISSAGALVDAEILARAVKKGYKITQKGVNHYPRTAGSQTGAKISVIVKAFVELFRLYRRIKKN